MQTVAEALSERLVVKAYTDPEYDATSEPAPATDPGATDGETWRFVSHNLSLARQSYSPNEMRTDQQQPIDKLGTRTVPVTTNHLLSCATHMTALEAVLGGTWSAAAVELDNTDLTSAAADNATAKFTFGGGDPVALGLRVGDTVRFASLSEAANNAINFLILAFGGTSNREMTVYPAPTDQGADSAFTVATVGRSLIATAIAPIRRKFALEAYTFDSDIAHLFTEIRFGGFNLNLAPNQDARIDFTGLGRGRTVYDGGSTPFFSGPVAQTVTEVISSMDGLLRMDGAIVGVATGLTLGFNRALSAPAQLERTGLAAGVVATANAVIAGEFTVFETGRGFHDKYDAASEFELFGYMPDSIGDAAAAMTFFLPRIKIVNVAGTVVDGAKALQCRYSGGRYAGAAPGVESTSLRIVDTEVS